MSEQRVIVQAIGGRQLEALAAGPADGLTVVLHNGTPAGLMPAPAVAAAAAERGLRLVLYARPGYGGSTPDPGRRVRGATADVAAVLDALGAGGVRDASAGLVAARTPWPAPPCCPAGAWPPPPWPESAPYHAEGLDWWHGMAAENLAEFQAAIAGPEALTGFLEPAARELASITGADVAAGLGDLASAADKAAVTGEFADYLAASFRAAVAGGIAGWRDDDLAFVTDWGFTMAEAGAGAPVAVWQGDQDMMVPWSHGQWLAAHIPGARAHLLPGEGHLTLVHSFGAILDDLLGPGRPPRVITGAPVPERSGRGGPAEGTAERQRERDAVHRGRQRRGSTARPRRCRAAPSRCLAAWPRHTTAATAARAVPSASAVPAGRTVMRGAVAPPLPQREIGGQGDAARAARPRSPAAGSRPTWSASMAVTHECVPGSPGEPAGAVRPGVGARRPGRGQELVAFHRLSSSRAISPAAPIARKPAPPTRAAVSASRRASARDGRAERRPGGR